MSGFEMNKIAAAILLAGLVFLLTGNLANMFYRPDLHPERGYQVEGVDSEASKQTTQTSEPVVVSIGQLMAQANAASGEKIAKKCAICHSFEQGQPHRVGPNLWATLMRKQATHEGFAYSKALSSMTGTWDYEALFRMIMQPRLYVPGTKMNFQGIANPQDVADVIAFLRTFGSASVPLPPADATFVVDPK